MAEATPVPTQTPTFEISFSSLLAGLLNFTFIMLVLFGYVAVMATFINRSAKLLLSAVS